MTDNADYQKGLELIDEDPIEAMEYFKKASDAGCKEASYEAGVTILENAIDVSMFDGTDYPLGTNEGYQYLVKAREQGCEKAKETMATYYNNGVFEPGSDDLIRKLIEN